MNPKGGTEILKEQLLAQLPEESIDGINLIGSICNPALVKEDKILSLIHISEPTRPY